MTTNSIYKVMYFTGIFLFMHWFCLMVTNHTFGIYFTCLAFFLKTWKTIRSFTRRTIHLKDDGISDSQEIMSPQSADEMLQSSTSDVMWTVVLEILFSKWPFRLHLWWIKVLRDCLLSQTIYCMFIVLPSCHCFLNHVIYSGLCSSALWHPWSFYLCPWTPRFNPLFKNEWAWCPVYENHVSGSNECWVLESASQRSH